MKNILFLSASLLVLTSCSSAHYEREEVVGPQNWSTISDVKTVEEKELQGWWKEFQDPVLDKLVEQGLEHSPDRKIAKARILESRGMRRAQRGSLFPSISASASGQRASNQATNFQADSLYDAGFDASYELDLFGKNLNAYNAADAEVQASKAEYKDVSLTLISEIVRNYIEFRSAEKKSGIANSNMISQQKTLDLVRVQKESGEAPQLDVERAEGLVNTTQASIHEYLRLADNARLRLGVLLGMMPQDLQPLLEDQGIIQFSGHEPVLMSPASVIALRPDIQAAQERLKAREASSKSAFAQLFPSVSLGAFFGVADSMSISSTNIWSGSVGAILPLLNFGAIRGNIDATNAREMQAYEVWRKTVLQSVADVETALTDYAHIRERMVNLRQAEQNAQTALDLSQDLYKEGEVSFIDVLDAQRTLYTANAEVTDSEEAYALSLVSLYKSLGVY